jgi:hypothetical protein
MGMIHRKKDFYIEIIKFARDNPGFTKNEFNREFPEQNKVLSYNNDIWKSMFVAINLLPKQPPEVKFMLNVDARFKLLEHEQLEQARKSSFWAIMIAIGSLFVAIGLMIISLLKR